MKINVYNLNCMSFFRLSVNVLKRNLSIKIYKSAPSVHTDSKSRSGTDKIKANGEPYCVKKYSNIWLNKTVGNSEPGFIAVDLETDGLISRTKTLGTYIPQMLQIGFAPLEMLAHKANTVSFYAQPIDSETFRNHLKVNTYLQRFYKSYFNGSYFIKRGRLDYKVDAVPIEQCINRFMRWKQEFYKDRPVYLVAHNALKFDKLILEYNLKRLRMFDSFQLQTNVRGWIDSLSIIRSMPNILQILGYPRMRKNKRTRFVWKKRSFSLSKLIEALSRRYVQLKRSKSTIRWPIFHLSHLHRNEEEEEWLHHFSRELLIRNCRDQLQQLTLHRSSDDVIALVCILQQLNLLPKFRRAHFQKDNDVIIPWNVSS